MIRRLQILSAMLLIAWFPTGVPAQHDHGDYDGAGVSTELHDDLEADHDDDNTDGHEDHSVRNGHFDDLTVALSREAAALVDLKISTASHKRIASVVELSGEVGFNEDKLVHIAPRFPGVALHAKYRVGDHVRAGEVMAVVESNESMNSYSITAPMSGWVIQRHITPGEFVSEENSIYMIADLSSVWINLAVYPKDFNHVRTGQVARIVAVGSDESTTGIIDYITPIIDLRTRSAAARISLPNPGNSWRPGTFVQAVIEATGQEDVLAVDRKAVQYLNEKSVVFVTDGPNTFRPVEVITGKSDSRHIQIVNGLDAGTEYVSKGAFELKAKIVTSNLDAHAGHGH